MKIIDLKIRNFKSVKDIHIQEIENALILVGQNNTGKTAILDAVRAMEVMSFRMKTSRKTIPTLRLEFLF